MTRRRILRAMGVMLTALTLLSGCAIWDWFKANDPPIKEPPCDAANPYQCRDGTCCYTGETFCWGPDSVGYYCEAQPFDPQDPNVFMKAKPKSKRHYARKRDTR